MLKNSYFALIDEILRHTGRRDFVGVDLGQIGLSLLICQLPLPNERSKLTSWDGGFSPQIRYISISESVRKIGSFQTFTTYRAKVSRVGKTAVPHR
jgi:hypothetical protein